MTNPCVICLAHIYTACTFEKCLVASKFALKLLYMHSQCIVLYLECILLSLARVHQSARILVTAQPTGKISVIFLCFRKRVGSSKTSERKKHSGLANVNKYKCFVDAPKFQLLHQQYFDILLSLLQHP